MPWSIRPSERRLTAALAGYFFLVVAALYLMKPARNALFLQDLGADRLPWVYIATALATWWVVVAYVRLTAVASMPGIVQGTLVGTLGCLAVFSILLTAAPAAGALAFYVWVKVYAVLLPSQFWLMSEEFLDPRQARRLFGPIGAGGVLGGIAGSAAAAGLARLIGTLSLLALAALAIAAAFVIFRWGVAGTPPLPVRHSSPEDAPDGGHRSETAGNPGDETGRWRAATPHGRALVLTIAAMLIVGTTAHTIVDWQFNKAAEEAIASQDDRTAFFGAFFTVLNVVTLVIQMVVTSVVLRHFGVGVALALLPVAIATGAFGILLVPGLWSASFARGSDDALRLSVDQSSRELLFLPLSSSDRRRIKPRVDLIASRAANGLGGVIVLAALWLLDDPLRYLSFVSLALVGLWATLVFRARSQYASALVRILTVRDPDMASRIPSGLDADAREAICRGLASHDAETIFAALDLAEHTEPGAFVDEMRLLLRTSDDTEIKSHVLRVLTDAHDISSLPEAWANVGARDENLTAEALAYASATGDAEARRRIFEYLHGREPLLAVAAAVSLIEHEDAEHRANGIEILVRAVGIETPRGVELKLAVADVIGQYPDLAALRPILVRLLGDEAPQVVRAALSASARRPHVGLVPFVCDVGARRNFEGAALQTLRVFGATAVGPLTGVLANPRNHRGLRTFAARALGRIGGSGSAAGLIAGLVADDRKVRQAALKALNYMRRRGERLDLGHEREAAAISIEWNDYLSLHRLAAALGHPGTDTPLAFAATVVNERLREAEERLFRALALSHPIQAVFFAYRGLNTGDGAARGHAIELLDSILETPERRTIVRLLETEDHLARGRIAALEIGRPVPAPADALRELLQPGDPWVAACAIRALELGPGSQGLPLGLRQELAAHDYAPLNELLAADV